jgi:hypothetical protein
MKICPSLGHGERYGLGQRSAGRRNWPCYLQQALTVAAGSSARTRAPSCAARRARYAHSMRVFVFNSGLFYIRPTPAALDLLDRLVARVESENGWDQAIFNEVIYVTGQEPRFHATVPRCSGDSGSSCQRCYSPTNRSNLLRKASPNHVTRR